MSQSSNPTDPQRSSCAGSVVHRIDPDRYALTDSDRHQLREKRGLSDATIHFAKFGSVWNQRQLDELGLEWRFDDLPSTIVIPYLHTRDSDGRCLYRLHRRSVPGSQMPLYVLFRPDASDIILVESEFKAAAAWQLGYTAIALQGIHSHIHCIEKILDAVRQFEDLNHADSP